MPSGEIVIPLGHTGVRTEVLEVSVKSVGEVQITVGWVNDQVVERAELATKVVVHKSCDDQYRVALSNYI